MRKLAILLGVLVSAGLCCFAAGGCGPSEENRRAKESTEKAEEEKRTQQTLKEIERDYLAKHNRNVTDESRLKIIPGRTTLEEAKRILGGEPNRDISQTSGNNGKVLVWERKRDFADQKPARVILDFGLDGVLQTENWIDLYE